MREMFSWPLKLLMAMVARLSMRETFSWPAKLLMAMVPRFATRVTSRLPLKVWMEMAAHCAALNVPANWLIATCVITPALIWPMIVPASTERMSPEESLPVIVSFADTAVHVPATFL